MATSAKKSTAAAKAAAKTSRAPAAPAKKATSATKKAAAPAKAPKVVAAKSSVAGKAAKAAAPAGKSAPKGKKAASKPAGPAKAKVDEKPTAAPGPTAGLAKPSAPRLTVRTPARADELKQKIGALATATANIRNLRRSLQRSFFDIGLILKDIEERNLYEVKGYGSFEAFVEREIDLGKQLGLRLARAVQVFQRDAALQAGLDRVSAAIAVLDGEVDPSATPPTAAPSSSGGARSPIPFHKQ